MIQGGDTSNSGTEIEKVEGRRFHDAKAVEEVWKTMTSNRSIRSSFRCGSIAWARFVKTLRKRFSGGRKQKYLEIPGGALKGAVSRFCCILRRLEDRKDRRVVQKSWVQAGWAWPGLAALLRVPGSW